MNHQCLSHFQLSETGALPKTDLELLLPGGLNMILNTLPKKAALAAIIAYCGIVWLNQWHQFVYTRSAIKFPPVSNWWRDSMIVLIPVMLAVWIGIGLMQWIIDHFGRRMSPSTQSILAAAILGGFTSFSIILTETNRLFQTGIGNEFTFLASICGRIYRDGSILLGILRWMLPDAQAFRFHLLVQDGFNLALINLAITILLIIILEGFVGNKNSYVYESQ